ncbi:HNH endonuclease [Mycobacterium phage LilSpotty]|uniref:HNH endonuclease n=1 Tax=Mycobacterium phage LilSpotty TaxID=2588512 RepID=A0A4Y6EP23_9CAUD|nr:HNH endonuclease [Mycobacterium phage LilSpotty]QDF19817.1 HNH endonuclease [Mycobacterium phage LilSpotty]
MATRNTAIRDRHRKTIARDQPPCGICGQPIDYTLPHDDPWSFVVDHVIPIAAGGPDTLANKQAAHRTCNSVKSDALPDPTGTEWMHVDTPTW